MLNLNKILLFCVILVLSLELILADPVRDFEITYRRGEYNEKVLPNSKINERLQCLDENADYCKKYPLSKVNCKHDISGFNCKSPDMPFLITFNIQSHFCQTKYLDNKTLFYPSSCYMRYSLMRNWFLIIGFIVGTILVVSIAGYVFIRIKRRN